jgi:hypothetical protein
MKSVETKFMTLPLAGSTEVFSCIGLLAIGLDSVLLIQPLISSMTGLLL